MKLFLAVIAFILVVLAILILTGLHYVRKGIIKFRNAMTGDLDDEETFKRMADKHYRGKDDPQFDKDYFKSAGTSRKAKQQRSAQSAQTRTTTTHDGVTIIDDRQDNSRQKIFGDDEGEYVEFTEVE